MKYFQSLPKIAVVQDNIATIRTNLMSRSSVIPELLLNPAVYYQYDIQDDDTPEVIAHKYYGNVYRYWIVLFANQILNPQWDWPLKSGAFNAYLDDKYANVDIYNTLDHYEKIVTTTDNFSGSVTTETFTISYDEYQNLTPSTSYYKNADVDTTISVTKRPVNIYEMEFEKNESKRSIKILNANYVNQIESEFLKLFKNKK